MSHAMSHARSDWKRHAKHRSLRPWMPLLGLALLAAPPALAQNNASCTLAAGSRAEATLSPPGGEDEDFLGRGSGGGLPYIAFVIDTSAHMRRFPVDLTSPEVRAQGLACSNTLLNALTYQANPCIDGKGQPVAYAAASCDATTQQPAGYGLRYRRDAAGGTTSTTYAPYDATFDGLFQSNRYYVHDLGWGADSTTVDSDFVKSTARGACELAGLSGAEALACELCVQGSGYYLPTDASVRPVLSGNWMNFNPPKYVIARKLLKDQFAALDAPSRTRQTMLTVVDTDAARCFSANKGSSGMDAPRDGAALIGNPTHFKPPCGQFSACVHNGSNGGGRAAFDNMVNQEEELFTSPSLGRRGGSCPSSVDVPEDAPEGTLAVRFTAGADKVCRASFVDAADTPLGEAQCAPYAEALLNAGQYLGDERLYDTLFPSRPAGTWRKGAFDEDDGVCPSSSCACPLPAVILLVGGTPGFDDNLPCEVTGRGCASTVPAAGTCGTSQEEVALNSNLARVARMLATANIKPTETYNSPAHVSTHVVAFGTSHPDLIAAAQAGGGGYFTATTAAGLRSALNEALAAASSTQYSFSNANISSVQTQTGSGVLVPRFTVTPRGLWPGRLFQYTLANEDTCGCREPVAANAPCDFNRDRRCGGVFFKDADGDFIAADAEGIFRKARLVAGTFRPGVQEATPVWEANEALQDKRAAGGQATSRRVLTVVDSNGDGAFDHQDETVSFEEGNAELLLPYLNVGTDAFCRDLGSRLQTCLSPVQCATRVIQYVRGMDVLDEDCDGDASEDRPDKLGDIFHASPVLVDPPLSPSSMLCRLGLSPQCLLSLTATPTPLSPESAFEDWAARWQHRDKLVLVGANDGMLHAFRGGRWVAGDNPETAGVDECPSEEECPGYYTLGDGEELWAFIPPDLLPKLSRLLLGTHQYFVDGSAMVREVWADANANARKEEGEFHTVAVVGERRGGTHFFALDVTDPNGPAELPARGFFRWMYPQPNTPAAQLAGQSYADFLPSPPPIGPVRVKTEGAASGTWQGSRYEERWVALLNGGHDPALLRGRTVNMVDVWRGGNGSSPGQALWTFDTGQQGYPFAATPAMVGFGAQSTNPNNDTNDYFFDTATVGDVGGQLWTLRFNHPDPARWSGARLFHSSASGEACGRQPFFHITANTVARRGGHLRTLAGTGDRFNLADRSGGECSATNLVGCLRRGCRLEQDITRTVCGRTASVHREYSGTNTQDACTLSPNTLTVDAEVGGSCCGQDLDVRADYTLTCTNSDGSEVSLRWQPRVHCSQVSATVCDSAETQFVCETSNDTPFDICSTFDRCDEPLTPPPSGFYAVKVFDEETPARAVFDTPEGAAAYGAAALTEEDLVQVNPYGATTQASVTDDGWYVAYGEPSPPGHVFPAVFTGSAVDERTVSPAQLVAGCTVFTTSTPGDSGAVCGPRAQLATTTYALNFLSGGACTGLDPGLESARVAHRMDTEPPAPTQLAVDLTPMGTVNIKLAGVSRSAGGALLTTPISTNNEVLRTSYRVPVTRDLHSCRHPEGATVAAQREAAQLSCQVE